MIDKIGSDKINKIIGTIMTIFVLCIIALYVYGQGFVHHERLFDDHCEEYTAAWYYTDENGETWEYHAPDSFDIVNTGTLTVETRLPDDLGTGSCFFYRTGKSFKAYIDGELREEYEISVSEFGRNVKSLWTKIDLNPSDSGKVLAIVKEEYPLDYCIIPVSYIGDRTGFLHVIFDDNKVILSVAFSLVILGLVVFVICLVQRIQTRKPFALWYMSIGVLAGAIWIILDNFMYPIIFGNYYIDGICEYLVVFLMPFPFLAYLNLLQERRYQFLYNLAEIVLIINFIVYTFLHFGGILDFDLSMDYSIIAIVLAALVCLYTMIRDIMDHNNKITHSVMMAGFGAMIIMALLEVIHINLPTHNNDGVFVAVGMILLLGCAIIHEILMFNALNVRTAKAQEANRAKTTFLANMSHEIRTPINAIMGMDELILREDINEETRGYAVNIKEASLTLLDLINDILDFSKIEQGKMEVTDEEYDIRQLINSVLIMISVKAEEKKLKLIPHISSDLPRGLKGDEKRIREIMINLLNNAVKYTHEGSITFSVTHEKGDEGSIVLIIKVSDTGIGIKESDMDRLFNQFERLDHKHNRNIEGTGLGLAITANLIRIMGGTIDCDSTYGVGTTFTARIPQIVTDSSSIGDINVYMNGAAADKEKDDPSADDKYSCHGARILVVDDNALNLKVAVRYLEALEAVPVSCTDGYSMLDIITREKFDLILLDHMMPEMDGIETLQKAMEMPDNLNKGVPVIALTANAISGARELYLENGFTDYLSKPMTIKDLTDILKKHLSGKTG
ncbi:MAG: response regulator [Lachnospiraceae bacterium]|nr:response regulator [Lachnospiraceae bacterium]